MMQGNTARMPLRAAVLVALFLHGLAPISGADTYREIKVTSGSTIRGKVTWNGNLPAAEDFAVYVDTRFCASSGKSPNDRISIDPQTRATKNAFVYLEDIAEGKVFEEAHAVRWPHRLHMSGCSFVDHVVPAAVGQMLPFLNSDQVMHTFRVAAPDGHTETVDMALQGGEALVPIRVAGFHYVTCRRHPWESAVIAAMQHPYYAVTDETGSFEIAEIPVGSYTLVTWHDSVKVNKTVRGGQVTGYSFPPGFSVSREVQLKPRETIDIEIDLRQPD